MKSSGLINEAANLKANENLTSTIQEMASKQYQKQRDLTDVIPTHRNDLAPPPARSENAGLQVFDPVKEKAADQQSRQVDAGDDDDLIALRAQRLAKLKQMQSKEVEWRAKQHGSYREITQDDFFNVVVRDKGGSDDVVVHFYHKDFQKCVIMDSRLETLAQSVLSIKFVKLNVEKAPFIVERLKVSTLPCLVLFHNDVAVDRVLGFEEVGTADDVNLDLLQQRLERGLKMHKGE